MAEAAHRLGRPDAAGAVAALAVSTADTWWAPLSQAGRGNSMRAAA